MNRKALNQWYGRNATVCNAERLEFQPDGRRRVEGAFDAGRVTSDGGLALLRELTERTGVLGRFAACFTDNRDPARIERFPKSSKPVKPGTVSAGRSLRTMIPRVHAGEGLVMAVKDRGHFMTVTGVTMSTWTAPGSKHGWEQWVTVTLDSEDDEVDLEPGEHASQESA